MQDMQAVQEEKESLDNIQHEENITISPWEQYIIKNPVTELDNENLIALLDLSRTYSKSDEVPLDYRRKFYAQAIEIEEECKKRGILNAA